MNNGSPSSTGFVIAGSALVAHGLLRRDKAGWFSIAVGAGIAWAALRQKRTQPSNIALPTFIHRTLTIESLPVEAYTLWRKLDNFPQLIAGLKAVEEIDANRHSWSMDGRKWETEIVNDQPGRMIEWKSVAGSPVQCTGSLRFKNKKGDRGTKIHLQMRYSPTL